MDEAGAGRGYVGVDVEMMRDENAAMWRKLDDIALLCYVSELFAC